MQNALSITGLTHRYGDTTALDGVDLHVAPGELVALLGPNGAGKTTLVRSAIGLIRPDGGTVEAAAGDPLSAATRRRLGVVQQEVGFPQTLTVAEVVAGAADRRGIARDTVAPTLVEMGLDGLDDRRATDLSGGQRQRLQLAMGLVADPDLLVLDEPTVGLDVASRRAFWRSITARRDRGAGVLLTTHIVDEAAEVADRVVVIDHGRTIATGTPDELARSLPDRRIEATTSLDAAHLASWPGVASARRDGSSVVVAALDAEAVVRRMLDTDPNLTDLTVSTSSLDDVLITLTTTTEVAA